jgi:hypothetical protein
MHSENTHYDQSPAVEWWVRFTPNNGKIFQISPREIQISAADTDVFQIIKTQDPDLCARAVAGAIPLRQLYVITDPISGEFSVAQKSRRLNLGSDSVIGSRHQNRIEKLRHREYADDAVTVTVHNQNNSLMVSINESVIKRTLGLSDIHEVAAAGNERIMDLYLSRHNNPDLLEHTVCVNILQLFHEKRFLVKLPTKLNLADISIWTVPVLGEYSLVHTGHLIETDAVLRPHAVIQRVENSMRPAHVVIEKNTNGVVLTSTISESDKLAGVANKRLNFIVSSSTIDNMVGTFSIDTNQLLDQPAPIPVPIDFEWPENPVIAYKNKYLVINYQGETSHV